MGIRDTYARDEKKVKEGAWIFLGGAGFLCRFVDTRSPDFQVVHRRMTKSVSKLIQYDALPPEKDRELAIDIFIEYALLGWEGVPDENGADIPYTPDAARKLFAELPQIFTDLTEEAGKLANYRPDADARKNSPTVSPTP